MSRFDPNGILKNGQAPHEEQIPNPPVNVERIKGSHFLMRYQGGGIVRLWYRPPLAIEWTIIDMPATNLLKFAVGLLGSDQVAFGWSKPK